MKGLARALTPPALWRAGSRLFGGSSAPAMFNGVFESFSEVEDHQPWTREPYLAASRQLLHECRDGGVPPGSAGSNAVLAMILNNSGSNVPRVLDWAGGTGLRYWTIRRSLNRPVAWHVVDKPELAALSREVMGDTGQLSFSDGWPPGEPRFEIALVYSALQYVEDQAALLRSIAGYRPRHIVLSRLMATHRAAYVTRQHVHGFNTPCKVSNLDEVASTLAASGYRSVLCVEDGIDLSTYFGTDVPKTLRVGFEHLLVFRAADA